MGFIMIVMGIIFIAAGLFADSIITNIFSGFAEVGSIGSIFTLSLGGVGALLVIFGGISALRGRRTGSPGWGAAFFGQGTRKLHRQILEIGVAATGEVTYVDRNYRILINNAPIYSIVEYKYRDSSGMEHINRIDQVSTESVVRSGIAVGSQIPIKYLLEEPGKSTIVPST